MSSRTNADYAWLVGLGTVAVLAFGYSVFIIQRAAAGVSIAVSLLLVYLFWRLVRGVERIATALEDSGSGGATEDEDSPVDGAGGAGETAAGWSPGGETGGDQ